MKDFDDHAATAAKLGEHLRSVRRLRGWSLRDVAEKADISAAYLQKLEKGQVQAPSPHMLHSLAEQLRVPYPNLMELAGYVVPGASGATGKAELDTLAYALSSEELSPDEVDALARYLSWYRSQQADGS